MSELAQHYQVLRDPRAWLTASVASLALMATAGRAQANTPQCVEGGPDVTLSTYTPDTVPPADDPRVDVAGQNDTFNTYMVCGTVDRSKAICREAAATAVANFEVVDGPDGPIMRYTCVQTPETPVEPPAHIPDPGAQLPERAPTTPAANTLSPGLTGGTPAEVTNVSSTMIEACIDAAEESRPGLSFTTKADRRTVLVKAALPDLKKVDGAMPDDTNCVGVVDMTMAASAYRTARNGHKVRNSRVRSVGAYDRGTRNKEGGIVHNLKALRLFHPLSKNCAGTGVRGDVTIDILKGEDAGKHIKLSTIFARCVPSKIRRSR